MTPHEVFASRWRAGRLQILGASEDDVGFVVDEEVDLVQGSAAVSARSAAQTIPPSLATVGLTLQDVQDREDDPSLPMTKAWYKDQKMKADKLIIAGLVGVVVAAVGLLGSPFCGGYRHYGCHDRQDICRSRSGWDCNSLRVPCCNGN